MILLADFVVEQLQVVRDAAQREPAYQRRARTRRTIDYHVRELEALGLEVTLCRLPEPEPGGSAATPAA